MASAFLLDDPVPVEMVSNVFRVILLSVVLELLAKPFLFLFRDIRPEDYIVLAREVPPEPVGNAEAIHIAHSR